MIQCVNRTTVLYFGLGCEVDVDVVGLIIFLRFLQPHIFLCLPQFLAAI